jgi:hypothetical protein
LPRRAWIVPVVLLFLVISVELARYLSAPGAERSDVTTLLRAQGRGDVKAMLGELHGCAEDPACAAQVRRNAARLRVPGRVKILLLESDTAYTLSSTTAVSRVAWTDIEDPARTAVQCITVRKSWSFVHGARVELRRIGPRIGDEASC